MKRLSANSCTSFSGATRKLSRILLYALLSVSVFSCGIGDKSSENAEKSGLTPMLPEAGQRYLHLTGTIGRRSASMELMKERGYEGNPFFSGYFYFDDEEQPMAFYSERSDSLKTLILNESAGDENHSGQFSGEFVSGTFFGTYRNQGKEEPFRLTISRQEGSIEFRSVSADTFYAASVKAPEPKARFSWHFLRPENQWLENSMLNDLHGDSLFRLGKGKAERIFRLIGKQYANDYREEVKPFLLEDEALGILNYDLSYGMDVAFNRNQLLSIIFTQYQYTGGAHGMLYSRCFSYDVAAKKKIGIRDVFRPGYEQKLKAAINLAAIRKYRVKKLSEVLLVDEIEPTGNFFLSGKGICFVYQPYEIGPFSMGEQLIYLPFSAIKDIVK